MLWMFCILCFHLDVAVWLEWVDSVASWSDGLSRDLAHDRVAADLGFTPAELEPDMEWWAGPLRDVWHEALRRVPRDRALG